MAIVLSRNVKNIVFKFCTNFLSRIVVHKFDNESKEVFRRLEKFTKCFVKTNADSNFLKFCRDNQLLPKFVNFKLYDVSATNDPETKEFKTGLLLREISRKESLLLDTTKAVGKEIVKLWNATKPLYFAAGLKFLQRILSQYEADILDKHNRKLRSLYGGEIFHSQPSSHIVNLSAHVLTDSESCLLNKGLNFGLKTKTNKLDNKIEMENLYTQIVDKNNAKTVQINKCGSPENKVEMLRNKALPGHNQGSAD